MTVSTRRVYGTTRSVAERRPSEGLKPSLSESVLRRFFRQIRGVDLAFDVKFFSAFLAVIFAKDADEQAFFLCFSSDLSRAARLNINHFSAKITVNCVFYHLANKFSE